MRLSWVRFPHPALDLPGISRLRRLSGGPAEGPVVTFWSQKIDERRNRSGRVRLLAGHHVRVRVERERHGRVTETLADDLHVHTGGEQLRRVGVAQVVEAD